MPKKPTTTLKLTKPLPIPESGDLIQVPGIYELKNKKMIIISEVDIDKRIAYDATGQSWLTNGQFTLTFSREWDIVSLVVKMPEAS